MMDIPQIITTPRLVLKPVSTKYLFDFHQAFFESFNEVTSFYIPAWSKLIAPPSKRDLTNFITENEKKNNNGESFLFFVFDKQTSEFIGQAELHHIDYSVPKARLGYWVKTSMMGNGYATELANALTRIGFDYLKCARLEIRSEVRNTASAKIAENLGYKHLAIFEKNKVGRDGEFWDLDIYCRLDKKNLPELEIEYDTD